MKTKIPENPELLLRKIYFRLATFRFAVFRLATFFAGLRFATTFRLATFFFAIAITSFHKM